MAIDEKSNSTAAILKKLGVGNNTLSASTQPVSTKAQALAQSEADILKDILTRKEGPQNTPGWS
ncbi:hypothetical protein Lqui_2900 [Legionella quinlivanii]|uniref:Uncharacterized protein n=1 Tax=Legionella quinlivanii TaxID=45073 RepID=A0A0W0XLG9_9GAMM|nr:hypothetical protein [Legionella quinlivanii]KTD45429.1 hypothetical protein Lqui_2900 [Legionella quinlivanii]MCW8451283.1 hypothetical protein [Legionella quinlivanii]SEG33866.1 hypothetical protein SAMN02746093_02586 [Legionella quinlivanii DSM 21216]STY10520.1 Uncharacterised protein [Legionella quinlivanii]